MSQYRFTNQVTDCKVCNTTPLFEKGEPARASCVHELTQWLNALSHHAETGVTHEVSGDRILFFRWGQNRRLLETGVL